MGNNRPRGAFQRDYRASAAVLQWRQDDLGNTIGSPHISRPSPGFMVGRVGAGGCPPAPPSEPYVKVSLHTAQVFIRPAAIGLTRGVRTPLGRTGTQPPRRCAPVGHSFETHQPTGVGRHLLSQRTAVRGAFLPFPTRPTWAYPVRYHRPLLFRSSPCCSPRPALR
jgi:hypothetical protein